jgi:hypothetical protein
MVHETARRRNAPIDAPERSGRPSRVVQPIIPSGDGAPLCWPQRRRGEEQQQAAHPDPPCNGSGRSRLGSCQRCVAHVPAASRLRRDRPRALCRDDIVCAAAGGSSGCGGRRWSRSSPKAGSHDRRSFTGVPRRALADRRRRGRETATPSAPMSRRRWWHADGRLQLRRASVSRRVAGTRGRARSAGGAAQRRSSRPDRPR